MICKSVILISSVEFDKLFFNGGKVQYNWGLIVLEISGGY